MDLTIKQIFISVEERIDEDFNPYTGNTDVIVQFDNDEKYVASFFAYKNIEVMATENKTRNAFLAGKYFWVNNLVLIECCSEELIKEVVQEMIDEGEFFDAFNQL